MLTVPSQVICTLRCQDGGDRPDADRLRGTSVASAARTRLSRRLDSRSVVGAADPTRGPERCAVKAGSPSDLAVVQFRAGAGVVDNHQRGHGVDRC